MTKIQKIENIRGLFRPKKEHFIKIYAADDPEPLASYPADIDLPMVALNRSEAELIITAFKKLENGRLHNI